MRGRQPKRTDVSAWLPDYRAYALWWAQRYAKCYPREDPDDICQDALEGLVRGLRHVDLGYKPPQRTVYLAAWIKQTIRRGLKVRLRNANRTESLDVAPIELEKKLAACERGGLRPTVTSVNEEHLYDPHPGPEEIASRRETGQWVQRILRGYIPKARERYVFFQNVGKERTLQSVGDELGVTRERIRQLSNKCIRELRRRQMVEGTLGGRVLRELYQNYFED